MNLHLQDKIVIVTGGASGIGAAVSLTLAQEGAIPVIFGKSPMSAEFMAQLGGASHAFFQLDLTNDDACKDAVAQTVQRFGHLHGLVNNAGITATRFSCGCRMTNGKACWDVNLTATMRLCRGVMRPMMKARWGRIINISSIVGATGNPGQANYAASKAGLVGMTKSIAYEVASRGITANAVAPGFIATAMTDKLTDDQKAAINTKIPAARMGAPEEIAAAVLYLASPEAGYVTGTTLHVNGGMAMI